MTPRYMSARPAYRRDYTRAKDVQAAWDRGDDFVVDDAILGSVYVNRLDRPAGMVLNVRYARKTKVCVIK